MTIAEIRQRIQEVLDKDDFSKWPELEEDDQYYLPDDLLVAFAIHKLNLNKGSRKRLIELLEREASLETSVKKQPHANKPVKKAGV